MKSEVSFVKMCRSSQMPLFDVLFLMNAILSVFYASKESKYCWGPPKALFSLKQQQQKNTILVTFKYLKSQAEVSRCTSQNSPQAHATPVCASMKAEPLQEASSQRNQYKIFSPEVSNHYQVQIWEILTWTDSFLSSFGNIL